MKTVTKEEPRSRFGVVGGERVRERGGNGEAMTQTAGIKSGGGATARYHFVMKVTANTSIFAMEMARGRSRGD